jgi:CRISPR/Cas system CSM-associated protein Csm4 (group 5 of RAMP superfamily)
MNLEKQLTELESKKEELKNQLNEVNKEIKTITSNMTKDKSIHILERHRLWVNSEPNGGNGYIIPNGAVYANLFEEEDFNRKQTCSVIDSISDYFDENFSEFFTDNAIEEFNKLDVEAQQKITDIIENAIEMDIDRFEWDW